MEVTRTRPTLGGQSGLIVPHHAPRRPAGAGGTAPPRQGQIKPRPLHVSRIDLSLMGRDPRSGSVTVVGRASHDRSRPPREAGIRHDASTRRRPPRPALRAPRASERDGQTAASRRAFRAWTASSGRAMADRLVEPDALTTPRRASLHSFLAEHLAARGTCPEESLATFRVNPSTRGRRVAARRARSRGRGPRASSTAPSDRPAILTAGPRGCSGVLGH
jgi:hypothetical protein